MQSKPTAAFRPSSRRELRSGLVRAALAIAAALAAAGAHAKTYCAHNASELQAALTDAGSAGTSNNQDNTIQVTNGTFTTSGAPFFFGTVSGFALTLEGGYNGTCSSQNLAPGISVLDGGGLTRVLSIQTNGDITVRHLTIQNANYGGSAGGGAAIALNDANAGEIAIFDGNIVRDNVDGFGTGGLTIFGNGTAYIENNLFVGNSAPAAAALSTSLTVGTVYITNNTITGNTNTGSSNMITGIGEAGATGHVSNTISYGNHGTGAYDFYLYGFEKVDFVHNDYTTIIGTPAPGGSGNLIGVDPRFVAVDDFHLRSTSPLLQAGTLTPAGGLPVIDLEGHPRSFAGHVDLGAFENVDYIFANGFDPN
ncbi:MAG TPA: choice-of-anchor Q domain-containing protein [Rudaea sp.]|nr:choice-of-anchor Q domain-containing protein [Rudaea sp.]